jgi:hypothetical protein
MTVSMAYVSLSKAGTQNSSPHSSTKSTDFCLVTEHINSDCSSSSMMADLQFFDFLVFWPKEHFLRRLRVFTITAAANVADSTNTLCFFVRIDRRSLGSGADVRSLVRGFEATSAIP